jgi:hypothetical protein
MLTKPNLFDISGKWLYQNRDGTINLPKTIEEINKYKAFMNSFY